MTTTPYPLPLGRLPDLEIAKRWAASISGEVHFSNVDTKSGEFFVYVSEAEAGGRKHVRIKYLSEMEIQARLLAYLMHLCDLGASIKISPAKLRSVRTLASLLLLNGGQSK